MLSIALALLGASMVSVGVKYMAPARPRRSILYGGLGAVLGGWCVAVAIVVTALS